MILAALLACGPKLEPLAPMVESIAKARERGPDSHPHVRFALSEKTLRGMIDSRVGPDKPIVIPVMIGTVATIGIDPGEPALDTVADQDCDCTTARAHTRGALDVTIGGLLGKQVLAEGLGFTAEVSGAPTFVLTTDGSTQQIALDTHPDHPWSVALTLDEEKGMLTNKLVDNQFERRLVDLLSKPVPLAKLGPEVPLRLSAIEIEAEEAPTASVWLAAEPGGAPPLPQVDEGWVATTTDQGALGVLRAVVAEQEQHPRWKLEPTGLKLSDGRFDATVRVHRVASKERWRDYAITGRIELRDDTIGIVPETVEQLDKKGWKGSLIGGFVTGTVRKQVMKQDIALPRTFTTEGKFPTRWTIDAIQPGTDGTFVLGSVELLPPPPPPAAEE